MGSLQAASGKLVVMGASTGGPGILLEILRRLPEETPGIIVVQHICEGFSMRLVNYMDSFCQMKVREARDGEVVLNGTIYFAGGGRHLVVKKSGDLYVLKYRTGGKVNGVCPSADELFASACCAGKSAMGVILTGMGKDGAVGLAAMRKAGAYTVGQDRGSSTVYSMPHEAKMLGAVMEELPPEGIYRRILKFTN